MSPDTPRSSGTTLTEERHEHGSHSDRGDPPAAGLPELREPTGRDRVRWGPIWAGIVVAVATFVLLQLALVAVGLFDAESPQVADAVWSAVAAGLAFLLGGVTAGATASWTRLEDGLLHGVVLWAVALVVLIVLSALGSGLALGAVDTTEVFDGITQDDVEQVLADDSQEAAGQALLALTVALLAAAGGGLLGAKLWPPVHDLRPERRSTGDRDRPAASAGSGRPPGG